MHLEASSYTRITISVLGHPAPYGKSLLFFFVPGLAFSFVVCNQDFFTSDFMIHPALVFGRKPHQGPVAQPGSDERVHVPNCETTTRSILETPRYILVEV